MIAMKQKWDWMNGGTRLALQVILVVFAAGVLWARVGEIEKAIEKLSDRMTKVEAILWRSNELH